MPAILESAGMLEHFYTDMTANTGLGKWLVRCRPRLGFEGPLGRLGGRRVPEWILGKTTSLAWPTLWAACNRALCPPDPAAKFREQLRWSRHLGSAMVRGGFGNATHLYSMIGECAPMLVEAKRLGITIISEIYILLSTERIVAKERQQFPEWEPPQPDLDGIRREFAQTEVLLTHTDFAVCPSEAVRADLEENFGFPCRRTAVVPYGVNQSWLALRPQPQAGRVLFVGTADLRKGIHYLAMAAGVLHECGRRYEFRIAGNVTLHIANQPLCRHLTFLGRIPRDRIHEEYASADVLVLPSLAEGSAEVTYEALAAGIPVITTSAAGSVVRDGIEGRLVPERDPMALALAIEQVVENRSLRASMAARARRRASYYTLERYGERLLAALRSFER